MCVLPDSSEDAIILMMDLMELIEEGYLVEKAMKAHIDEVVSQ
jgi:hypothetical protein